MGFFKQSNLAPVERIQFIGAYLHPFTLSFLSQGQSHNSVSSVQDNSRWSLYLWAAPGLHGSLHLVDQVHSIMPRLLSKRIQGACSSTKGKTSYSPTLGPELPGLVKGSTQRLCRHPFPPASSDTSCDNGCVMAGWGAPLRTLTACRRQSLQEVGLRAVRNSCLPLVPFIKGRSIRIVTDSGKMPSLCARARTW